MKKVFLILAIAAASISAKAQVYVGGGVGFWRNSSDNHTSVNLEPEVGYKLSDKWALGIGLGYEYHYVGYENFVIGNVKPKVDRYKALGFYINPYARWNCVSFGPVSFFLDMGIDIGTLKTNYDENDPDDINVAWQVGVQPGVKVALCKNLDFIAHCGFFGYRDNDNDEFAYGEKGFGLKLSSRDLVFGVNYNF